MAAVPSVVTDKGYEKAIQCRRLAQKLSNMLLPLVFPYNSTVFSNSYLILPLLETN